MTTAYIEIEVDLESFSDEDIEAEYEERFGAAAKLKDEEFKRLQRIYHAMRLDKPEAKDLMWEYIRDTLGVVL
jgi:hypothetical protein